MSTRVLLTIERLRRLSYLSSGNDTFFSNFIQGKYCDGTDTTTTFICPKGFYCPAGTKYPNQYPCPAGKYNPSEGKGALSDCLNVDKGYWNDDIGVSILTKKIM